MSEVLLQKMSSYVFFFLRVKMYLILLSDFCYWSEYISSTMVLVVYGCLNRSTGQFQQYKEVYIWFSFKGRVLGGGLYEEERPKKYEKKIIWLGLNFNSWNQFTFLYPFEKKSIVIHIYGHHFQEVYIRRVSLSVDVSAVTEVDTSHIKKLATVLYVGEVFSSLQLVFFFLLLHLYILFFSFTFLPLSSHPLPPLPTPAPRCSLLISDAPTLM